MGAPSGSKNCSILTDRLDFLASQFERPVYDTSNLEADTFGPEPSEREADKKLKASELQAFRIAASGARIERKLGLADKMVPKPMQAGPQPEKRKLPGFVKLKSKEGSTAEDAEEAPPEKRARAAAAGEGGAKAPAAGAAAAPPADAAPAPADSPQGGVGLVGYDSDSEEDE